MYAKVYDVDAVVVSFCIFDRLYGNALDKMKIDCSKSNGLE